MPRSAGIAAVDAAAREVLGRYGLGEAFGHGTGHGLGLEVHEEPRLGRPVTGLEDDVLVTDMGCEVLTRAGQH